MRKIISGVDYENGHVTGVTISGIVEVGEDEPVTAFFRREVYGRWEEADWVEPDCHGFELVRTPKAALRCSNCKNCFKKELLWKDNYCPNCGAKMDLED